MKQMKFFLVALMTVVMSVSVTSCMNGDDNTIVQWSAVAKCINTYPPTFQTNDGQKLVINDASLLTLDPGKIYSFWFEFDTAEQPSTSPTLNVTLFGGSTPTEVDAKYTEGPANITESTSANAPLFVFNSSSELASVPAVMFDQQYLVVPIFYWVKVENSNEDQQKEFDKHTFVLTYDEETITPDATELVLTLNHVIDTTGEEKVTRDRYTNTIKAYRLENAMFAFRTITGKNPTKITVKAKVNSSRNDLSGANDATPWEYTIK